MHMSCKDETRQPWVQTHGCLLSPPPRLPPEWGKGRVRVGAYNVPSISHLHPYRSGPLRGLATQKKAVF